MTRSQRSATCLSYARTLLPLISHPAPLVTTPASVHPSPSLTPPPDDEESEKCHLGAVIVRDLSIVVSNYRSVMTLDEYCKKHNVLGISGIDTRALTKVWSGARGAGAWALGVAGAGCSLKEERNTRWLVCGSSI